MLDTFEGRDWGPGQDDGTPDCRNPCFLCSSIDAVFCACKAMVEEGGYEGRDAVEGGAIGMEITRLGPPCGCRLARLGHGTRGPPATLHQAVPSLCNAPRLSS